MLFLKSSNRAGNFTRTQTAGTNIHMAGRTVDDRLDALDIGLPHLVGATVRMGDLDPEGNPLSPYGSGRGGTGLDFMDAK